MEGSNDRYFTMSITTLGPSTMPKKADNVFAEKITNDISDIDGASRTMSRYERYVNKPIINDAVQVPGSTSRALTHGRNCRDNQLFIDDIDGTRPHIKNKILMTKRHVDPLNPSYSLPTFQPVATHEPKFLRDTLNVGDIDGTKSTPLFKYSTRDTYSNSDILGSQVGWRPRHEKVRLEGPPADIMNAADISKRTDRFIDKTSRLTDVMNPQYRVNGMDYFDDPRFTKPKKLPPFTKDSKLLVTQDILAGPEPNYRVRREYANTNFVGDIEGAQADTIKHSIRTLRETHPLQPVYQGLDFGEPLVPVIQPLIPATLVNIATLRTKKHSSLDSTNPLASSSLLSHTRRPSEPDLSKTNTAFRSQEAAIRSYAEKFSDPGAFIGGNTGDFGSNQANDEPVLFTDPVPTATGRPPRPANSEKFKLDFNNNTSGNNNNAAAVGWGNTAVGGGGGSGRTLSHSNSAPASNRGKNDFMSSSFTGVSTSGRDSGRINNNSSKHTPQGSARQQQQQVASAVRWGGAAAVGGGGGGASGAGSARQSARESTAERRAARERMDEINSVRDLR